ncbi:hypothetical protein PI126_g15063 [Phytophthora idaei]|nr:hypothetical protein PI126_g15063 [Phytophthora idaei]
MWRRVYAEQEQQPGATGRKSNEDGGDASRRYDDMDDGGVTRAGDIDAPDNFEAAEVSSGARVDPVEPVQLPLDNAKGGDTGSGSDWSHGGDNAGGDDSAGAGASLTGRRSDEVWRVAMRPVITTAETEGRLVPRAIGPIGGVAQSIAVVKNLLRWLMLGRFGCACKRAGKCLRGCFRQKHGVKGGAIQPPEVTQTVKEMRIVTTREGDVMTSMMVASLALVARCSYGYL